MTDKLEQHYGHQLSALMDGELAPDQARFLLRRLRHDGELADAWERWQLAGDVLRGRAGALLPEGFARRIDAALRADAPPPVPRRDSPLLRWSGVAALAASVAVVALMVPRPAPDAQAPAAQAPAGGAPVVAAPTLAPASGPAAPQGIVRAPEMASDANIRAAAPVAVAVVAAPRPAARRAPAFDREPAQRPASPPPASPIASGIAIVTVASQPLELEATAIDPFSSAVKTRPWPKAVLPQFGHRGALAAGLPADDAGPSFYPFEPRLPTQDAQPGQPESEAAQAPY